MDKIGISNVFKALQVFPLQKEFPKIPLRWLKVAILKLPLPLPLLQTAIMEIRAILKALTDAAAASSKTCRFL